MIPTKCQHIMMEEFFENPFQRVMKQPCGMMCSLCEYGANIMGHINRDALQSRLISFFTHKCTTPSDLVKHIKLHKSIIFHKDDVPYKFMGPVHALCLQLILNCIIDLAVQGDKMPLMKD